AMPWAAFASSKAHTLHDNFGDGHTTASGSLPSFAFAAQLLGTNGRPVTINGLWALQFGNGSSAGDANALYFSAGPAGGTHGLFGSLKVGSQQGGLNGKHL